MRARPRRHREERAAWAPPNTAWWWPTPGPGRCQECAPEQRREAGAGVAVPDTAEHRQSNEDRHFGATDEQAIPAQERAAPAIVARDLSRFGPERAPPRAPLRPCPPSRMPSATPYQTPAGVERAANEVHEDDVDHADHEQTRAMPARRGARTDRPGGWRIPPRARSASPAPGTPPAPAGADEAAATVTTTNVAASRAMARPSSERSGQQPTHGGGGDEDEDVQGLLGRHRVRHLILADHCG